MTAGKRRALGRGLAALLPGARDATPSSPASAPLAIPETTPRADATAPAAAGSPSSTGLRMVGIEDVHAWKEQPRRTFEESPLEELAASIRSQGVLQPIIVRRRDGGGYEIIDGERRWRAAQRAGALSVPVVVRDIPPEKVLETSLVLNLQREDLNPIELAEGYQRLLRDFSYTQEMLADRLGKDRSTVANVLRLLKLPPSVRDLVTRGQLSMGHARALLGLDSVDAMERLARRAIAQGLSVRQVERAAQQARTSPSAPASSHPTASARDLGERLQRVFGVRVKVAEAAGGRGRVEFHFASLDELDRLLAKLLP